MYRSRRGGVSTVEAIGNTEDSCELTHPQLLGGRQVAVDPMMGFWMAATMVPCDAGDRCTVAFGNAGQVRGKDDIARPFMMTSWIDAVSRIMKKCRSKEESKRVVVEQVCLTGDVKKHTHKPRDLDTMRRFRIGNARNSFDVLEDRVEFKHL